MKKLMIAAAIVSAAAMSQAATVTWKSGTTMLAADAKGTFSTDTKNDKAGSTVSAMLYGIDKDTYDTWLLALATDVAAGSKTIYDGVGSFTQLGDTVKFNKGAATLTDTRDISAAGKGEDAIDLYSAIIYTYTDADDKTWYIANVGTQHFEANVGNNLDGLALKVGGAAGTTSFTGWQTNAVPEPTSGLLLLLGVAGLALRRRRA